MPNDAPIGVTALHEHCALIISDKKLRRGAEALGIEVLHARELLTELGFRLTSVEHVGGGLGRLA